MKNHGYLLSLFTLLFLFGILLFFPKHTYADNTSLTVSPTLIRIQAKPPADVWTPFTIENTSNQALSLKIGYKTFDPQNSSNGTVVFLNDGQPVPGADKKIFEKMQIVDDQNVSHDTIDIGPKQQLRFRLRITLPANEPVSDYYFSLIFLQRASPIDQTTTKDSIETQKSFSTIQAGLGINVLLSVGDKKTPQGSIDNFSAPSFLDGGTVLFSLSLHNAGTHFINPHGVIMIKNLFGQTVGKVPVPPTVILAGTSRKISSTGSPQNASTAIAATTAVTDQGLLWPEKFLLGMYTATLTLTLSDNGPVYVRTIHFIAFPFLLFIEVLLFLSLLVYIYLRVKRKLSND